MELWHWDHGCDGFSVTMMGESRRQDAAQALPLTARHLGEVPRPPKRGSAAPVLVHRRSVLTTNAVQHPASEAACQARINGSHPGERQLVKRCQPAELVEKGQTGACTSSTLEEATCCSHVHFSDSFRKCLLDTSVFCAQPVGSSSIYY